MPAQIAVLADDLTGAHASAAALRSAGLRPVMGWATLPGGGNAIVIDMRTRDHHGDPRLTARRWGRELAEHNVQHVELRIDSTLRGATGEELAGLREALGEDVMQVTIPAYPSAGRRTRGGVQSAPPGIPVAHGGDVGKAVFGHQRYVGIDTETLRAGTSDAVTAVLDARAAEHRHFVLDGLGDDDLRCAAGVISALRIEDGPLVTISPGAWLKHMITSSYVLVVVGSATASNRIQIAELGGPGTVRVQVTGEAPPKVITGTIGSIPPRLVLIETLAAEGASDELMHAVAEATLETLIRLRPHQCAGVIVTGGHTASHVVDKLGATGVIPLTEPEPLCAAGLIQGGQWDATFVITKGGLVGDAGTLVRLRDWLMSRKSRDAEPVITAAIGQRRAIAPVRSKLRTNQTPS
jgi:D-threonate/D-erythronate kinase